MAMQRISLTTCSGATAGAVHVPVRLTNRSPSALAAVTQYLGNRHHRCHWLAFLLFIVLLLVDLKTAKASIEPAFVLGGHDIARAESEGSVHAMLGALRSARSDAERAPALSEVQKRADAGDADAAYVLATAYLYKLGLAQDYERSRGYFQQAAAKGFAPAYYQLARMDFLGLGEPRNIPVALSLLERCAQSLCLYEEAAIYYYGAYDVPRDPAKALALAIRAAEMGDRKAKWAAAKLYLLGEGTTIDVAKGMSLMRSLSEQGYGKATGSLGELYADPKVRNEFFDGNFNGENVVPDTFARSVPADYAKAMSYWQTAAQQGNCHAYQDLGSFYDRGVGVALDYSKGTGYLAQAVQCAPTDSFYIWRLAMRLKDGKGVPRNCETAAKLFTASLTLGYANSAVDLGYLYDKGCDTLQHDDKRALQIYLVGAKAGVPLAQNNVGAMLKHGRGIGTPDLIRGYAWMALAAENGDELAQKNLENFAYMFTDDDRAKGMVHLKEIRSSIGRVDTRPLSTGELNY